MQEKLVAFFGVHTLLFGTIACLIFASAADGWQEARSEGPNTYKRTLYDAEQGKTLSTYAPSSDKNARFLVEGKQPAKYGAIPLTQAIESVGAEFASASWKPVVLTAEEKVVAKAKQETANKVALAGATHESLLALTQNASVVSQGKAHYSKHCASCHGVQGGGGVGPNLTDAYWLHGSLLTAQYLTIWNGIEGQGMAAWADKLQAEGVKQVVAYIGTMRDTNVPGGKEAQGVKSEALPSDSVPQDAP